MGSPLRLDLRKYGVSRFLCGCFVKARFTDAVNAVGLVVTTPEEAGRVARASGWVRYIANGDEHCLRAHLHTVSKSPGTCCFHLEHQLLEAADSRRDVATEMRLSALDAGIDDLGSGFTCEQRNSQLYVALEGEAPVIAAVRPPQHWPNNAKIEGLRLVAPGGEANAIVQEFGAKTKTTTVVVHVEGGHTLSSRKVGEGFRVTRRLAAAFRDGDWKAVQKGVADYGSI